MIEQIARALEPLAWAALGSGDTAKFTKRRESSLHKAERVLEVFEAENNRLREALNDARLDLESLRTIYNDDARDRRIDTAIKEINRALS